MIVTLSLRHCEGGLSDLPKDSWRKKEDDGSSSVTRDFLADSHASLGGVPPPKDT